MTTAPAEQMASLLTAYLQSTLTGVDATQVRRVLDLTGEDKGLSGVVVSVTDNGGYGGRPDRVLITMAARVDVYTHLEDDASGDVCRAIASEVLEAVQGYTFPGLVGWAVPMPSGAGAWSAGGLSINGSYRGVTLQATVQLMQAETEASASDESNSETTSE